MSARNPFNINELSPYIEGVSPLILRGFNQNHGVVYTHVEISQGEAHMSSQKKKERTKKTVLPGDLRLGQALRELRGTHFKKGYERLAKVVHMNKDKVGDFERGRRLPESAELRTILRALKVSKIEWEKVFNLHSAIAGATPGTNQSYVDYSDTLAHESRQSESVAEQGLDFRGDTSKTLSDDFLSATATSLEIPIHVLTLELDIARRDERENAARAARIETAAAVIRQGLVSKTLTRYYTPASLEEGNLVQYAINVDGTRINLAVATKSDWIDRSVKLVGRQEECKLVSAPRPQVQIPVKSIARQLAFIEKAGTRIWNAPLYRLVDIFLSANRLVASFSLDEYLRRRFTIGLLHDELVEAIIGTDLNIDEVVSNNAQLLPLRHEMLPNGSSLANLGNRMCGGGPDVLVAIARPKPDNDFVIPVKRRSMDVATVQGLLSLVPQACHQPMVDRQREVNLSFTVYREIYEELFKGEEIEKDVRQVKPDWFFGKCEPVRWLRDHKDKCNLELTSFGIEFVCGNYIPGILLAVRSEEFWKRYGDLIATNWEVSSDVGLPLVSSRDRQQLSTLIRETGWNEESLFSFIEGLKRLKMLEPRKVDLPNIEQLNPTPSAYGKGS